MMFLRIEFSALLLILLVLCLYKHKSKRARSRSWSWEKSGSSQFYFYFRLQQEQATRYCTSYVYNAVLVVIPIPFKFDFSHLPRGSISPVCKNLRCISLSQFSSSTKTKVSFAVDVDVIGSFIIHVASRFHTNAGQGAGASAFSIKWWAGITVGVSNSNPRQSPLLYVST